MYNVPALDFDLVFDAKHCCWLDDAIEHEEHALGLGCMWPRHDAEWDGYLQTYMAGIKRYCLREEPKGAGKEDLVCACES